jgi:hypothetical protein
MLVQYYPSNVIVNAASIISYRPLIQADVCAVLFMNELNNLMNVLIGKLGKLDHKQNCYHDFFYIYIITSLLYKLDILLLKQKKLPVLAKYLGLHLSTHAEQ